MDNSEKSVSQIQNIGARNAVGESLKQKVRNEITEEGVQQGMSRVDAEQRTRQLESWGELENEEPLFAAGENLQSKAGNN